MVADAAGQFAGHLSRPRRNVPGYGSTTSDDNLLDDIDPVHAPFDCLRWHCGHRQPAAISPAQTSRPSSQDIGANYAVLADDEDISGDWVVSGSMNFQDNILQRAMFQDVAYLNAGR